MGLFSHALMNTLHFGFQKYCNSIHVLQTSAHAVPILMHSNLLCTNPTRSQKIIVCPKAFGFFLKRRRGNVMRWGKRQEGRLNQILLCETMTIKVILSLKVCVNILRESVPLHERMDSQQPIAVGCRRLTVCSLATDLQQKTREGELSVPSPGWRAELPGWGCITSRYPNHWTGTSDLIWCLTAAESVCSR